MSYRKLGQDEDLIDSDVALARGYSAMQTFFPQAKSNCEAGENNCFTNDVNFDGEKFTVNASMKLPLMTMLRSGEVNLSYSDKGHWEGAYQNILTEE